MKNCFSLSLTVALLLSSATAALACPTIGGLVDFNCDRQIRIGVLGDSFVAGRGDTGTGTQKGYVTRLEALPEFQNTKVTAVGLSGYSSFEILIEVQRSLGLSNPNRLKKNLSDLDLLILDLGRNDFFVNITPAATVKNIRALVKVVNQRLGHGARLAPLIAIAKLPSTSPLSRPMQRKFISIVDSLLDRGKSAQLPVRVPFQTLPPSKLSSDGLHPNPSGHAALADIAAAYILGDAQVESLSKRPDSDADGVYDAAEAKLFQTNTSNADSDGDTLSDLDEIFSFKTSPLLLDTDGDGFSDSIEISSGSDPVSAASFPA
jgi:lysophospholipase L1-like esterase